jgi:hypothetical protein
MMKEHDARGKEDVGTTRGSVRLTGISGVGYTRTIGSGGQHPDEIGFGRGEGFHVSAIARSQAEGGTTRSAAAAMSGV